MGALQFFKYQGTGNDFVVIDNRNQVFDPADELLVHNLCDRRFGIGADGLMLLEHAEGYDFRMIYFNADGKEGTMCGNGGRCLAAFAHRLGLVVDGYCRFLAVDGPHEARVVRPDWVELKMIDVPLVRTMKNFYVLNTGSPHVVSFREGLEALDVAAEGMPIRWSDDFQPEGTNVNFVEKTESGLSVATYERGVEAETLSCGTGVTAAALCMAVERDLRGAHKVPVWTRGGDLAVKFFRGDDGGMTDIWLCGPATLVFEGMINTTNFFQHD